MHLPAPLRSGTLLSRVFIAAPLAAMVVGSGPREAAAFDPEDYATTYRATRDARFNAERGYFDAFNRFRLWQGIMALYGYVGQGGGIYNDPSTGYLESIGADLEDAPPWCRAHAVVTDRQGPASPAVRFAPSRFVVGQEDATILRYSSEQYAAAGEDAYLHFRTEGGAGDDPASVIASFIAAYPYANASDRADAQAALAEALAWRAAGHPSWAEQTAGWMLPRSLEGRYAEWFEPGGDVHTTMTAVANNPENYPWLNWHGYCFDDDALCPDGTTCQFVDPTSPGLWYLNFGTAYAWDSKYHFRCVSDTGPSFDWPPNRVDAFSERYRPTLIASSDTEDSPGLHNENGIPSIEDLMTTYRMSRDMYNKSRNELKLSEPPHRSARAANVIVQDVYLQDLDRWLD